MTKKQLLTAGAVALPAIIAFLLYAWVPSVIKSEVADQLKEVTTRLVDVQTTVKGFDGRLGSVESSTNRIGDLKNELSELRGELRGFTKSFIKTASDAETALKRAVSASASDAKVTLPFAGKVIETAKEKRIRLSPKAIKEIAESLFAVSAPDASLVVWDTASRLASYKTFSEGMQGVPKPPKDAQDRVVVQNATVDLGGKRFENVSFVNCNVQYMDSFIELENVRFIDCTFDEVQTGEPGGNGREFLQALLLTDEKPSLSLSFAAPPSRPGADRK